LLTDGAHTGASDPADLAQPLAAQGVRVFPILPASTPPNVSLVAVEAPLEVREGATVDATLRIESTTVASIALEVDGGSILRETFEVAAGATEHQIRFRAAGAGARIVRYALRLDGSPWTDDDSV